MSKRRRRHASRRHRNDWLMVRSPTPVSDASSLLSALEECVRCLMIHLGDTNKTLAVIDRHVAHLHSPPPEEGRQNMDHDHDKRTMD